MAAIIELALPPDEFAIETTLATLSDVEADIERVVATNPEQITPYVWVRTDDFEAFEAAVRDDPTVDGMTLLSETETGNERAYQMTWIGSIDLAVELLTEHQGTITHAEGSDEGWHLRVVFPDRATLSQAYDAIREAGFQVEVQAIYGRRIRVIFAMNSQTSSAMCWLQRLRWDILISPGGSHWQNWLTSRSCHIRHSQNESDGQRPR